MKLANKYTTNIDYGVAGDCSVAGDYSIAGDYSVAGDYSAASLQGILRAASASFNTDTLLCQIVA